jgi:hypothetical protein
LRSPPLPKALSGIQGLDEVTTGGLPKGRPTLISGGPGSGKTMFGIDPLYAMPLSFLLMGVTMVLFGTVRANGAVIGPLVILAIGLIPVRLGFAFGAYPWLKADALWISFPVSSLANVSMAIAFYLQGGWKKARMGPERHGPLDERLGGMFGQLALPRLVAQVLLRYEQLTHQAQGRFAITVDQTLRLFQFFQKG